MAMSWTAYVYCYRRRDVAEPSLSPEDLVLELGREYLVLPGCEPLSLLADEAKLDRLGAEQPLAGHLLCAWVFVRIGSSLNPLLSLASLHSAARRVMRASGGTYTLRVSHVFADDERATVWGPVRMQATILLALLTTPIWLLGHLLAAPFTALLRRR